MVSMISNPPTSLGTWVNIYLFLEFTRKLLHEINEVFNLNIHFTVCEILLGLSTYNDAQIKMY